ncbi:hypothetical protein J3Q64DRAFT_1846402 [Phycomyces blakesleeanus]|uniref:Uncharacterized protein n=2 Tax=Phycomyces blakesleeanus TaxID=4837 RepID=A0A162V773_PHYB8|nr:hypothetical protein PHYBLDRAFT_138095 [Phycomyces blakesleeanus NRRL 1555(-)]OAD80533.1 hypothetical protein PHYBLDRAFT_138095 [Phycomyces blakesleeanus NRRL 1555(-)]|eukprot:XP_018298573.1 hypothetical protein PHYBLDRAFT_138095 [Phycomyces blakesleeanus NRRL 1555(-)]
MNLQCPLCFKEFPMYDQRGFRNAGFTAHHNRCVEKEVQKVELSSGDTQRTIHPRRRLLPAPSYFSPSINNMGSVVPSQRLKLTVSKRYFRKPRASPKSQIPLNNPPAPSDPNPSDPPVAFLSPIAHNSPKSEPPPDKPLPQPWELQEQFIQQQLSFFATAIEEQIPVHYCDYCLPQQGLHHPSCTLLHFASRANNAFD